MSALVPNSNSQENAEGAKQFDTAGAILITCAELKSQDRVSQPCINPTWPKILRRKLHGYGIDTYYIVLIVF